ISHSNQSQHRQKHDNETSNRKKSVACPTIPPMPQASQNAQERDQRQPFQDAGGIESPVWVDRDQSDRSEKMCGVPPDRHCGIYDAARKRSDNNLLFADTTVLKPERDQAQSNRDQEKWHGSKDVAPEVLVGFGPSRLFALPPGAQQQNKWQKHDLRF